MRTILGSVGCAPTPLTIPEIEQALVVNRGGVAGDGKVIASLNLPRICGPIVEVVDEYVQFVHFTVKECVSLVSGTNKGHAELISYRYLFSPKIEGCLQLTNAITSLAACCVTYLSQRHHQADLMDEDMAEKILSGLYRFHNFAATTWLELVERSAGLHKRNQLPDGPISVLEVLRLERGSDAHVSTSENPAQLSLKAFESEHPLLHDMLCSAIRFRQRCLEEDFSVNKGTKANNCKICASMSVELSTSRFKPEGSRPSYHINALSSHSHSVRAILLSR